MDIKVSKKEGRVGTLTVIVDDDHWRDIHTTIFGKRPSFPDPCHSIEDLEAWFLKTEYKLALQYAIKRLSLKNQPSTELQQALEQKLVSPSVIEKVIRECQSQGFLNDEYWLECFIRAKLSKNISTNAILMKLRVKGINRKTAEGAIAKLDGNQRQPEQISKLLSTKYRNKDLNDYKTQQKVVASLLRKGFSLDSIFKVLKCDDF